MVGQLSRFRGQATENNNFQFTFVDLFCGIGGFRVAAESFGWRCVYSCDIDKEVQQTYGANFGEMPDGDIRQVDGYSIPDHDVLFAGFPCQPFSIIGSMNGMNDTRGTLFYDIARILKAKQPSWFVLENVKQLVGNDGGHTLDRILSITRSLGYIVDWRILNALHFGLPQKRERVYIVGSTENTTFEFPNGNYQMKPLAEILEETIPTKYYASQKIRLKRQSSHQSKYYPSIWHENKAGHISSYPYSCALRAAASYNYLLVNGERRLTPREQLRLQGFPDWFVPTSSDSEIKKQTGNAVPVPVVEAIIRQIIRAEESVRYGTKNKETRPSQASLSAEPISS
jgi:DNA (cytosine-5)-methyltransferase 1